MLRKVIVGTLLVTGLISVQKHTRIDLMETHDLIFQIDHFLVALQIEATK